jgi:hypothetical protein
MRRFLNYLAGSKSAICVAWFILFFPALASTIYGDPFFLPILYFVCLALYLQKVRSHLVLPSIIYIFLMLFPPYFYFIRWLDPLIGGQISFNEYILQEHALLHFKLMNLPPLGVLFAVLSMPSIYIINLRKILAFSQL